MSAEGELYVNEVCRDAFEKELDKIFGKYKWSLDGTDYNHIWNSEKLPNIMPVEVRDSDTDEKLGVIEIKNKFEIEEGQFGKYIETYPVSFKLVEKYGKKITTKRRKNG